VDIIEEILKNIAEPERPAHLEQPPVIAASQDLPARPPTLCAGCPHRSSFYAIKKAVGKKKAYHSGDIGCYTLGNAAPLHMVDTCLCMGAGITMAQGMHISEPDALNFAYVGDSTFFASGITGAINAIYNQHNIILIVLDNSTTAMTGNQPHPGTGIRMTKPTTDDTANAISIPRVLEAIGFSHIEECDPHNITNSIEVVKTAIKHSYSGKPSAIIFKAPCITLFKKNVATMVDSEKCTACNKCVMELGCPAMQLQDKLMRIDESLCYGCAACVFTCPFSALVAEGTGA
jgi:indolepyruvate ferredoxin oxidoreductase alpha subunit